MSNKSNAAPTDAISVAERVIASMPSIQNEVKRQVLCSVMIVRAIDRLTHAVQQNTKAIAARRE
jgi:hypothetical protein